MNGAVARLSGGQSPSSLPWTSASCTPPRSKRTFSKGRPGSAGVCPKPNSVMFSASGYGRHAASLKMRTFSGRSLRARSDEGACGSWLPGAI